MSMDSRFSKISEAFLEEFLASSPVTATGLGDHRFDDQLDHVDEPARKRRVAMARSRLDELDEIDFGQLSRSNQVDYLMLSQRLEQIAWEVETLREWEWNPLVYAGIPGSSLYLLLSRDFAPLPERLALVAARCRQFERFFGQARDSLSKELTPRIHAETAVEQNRGILTLIELLVLPELASLTDEQRAEVESAIREARAAIEEHQRWLEDKLLPKAQGNPRLEEGLFRQKFAYSLFNSFTPEELRNRANGAREELHRRMYELSVEIIVDSESGFAVPEDPTDEDRKEIIRRGLELACEDAPSEEEVVAAAYHSLEITTQFVRDKDLLTLPGDPLEIILMPEFRRGVSVAYCDAPGPLEKGGKTFYAVSPPPEEWSEQQVQSFLREYNRRSLHNLTVHEAMPGHYVQLLLSNESSTRLRSVLASGTFIEGWAVYTEGMMIEQGFLSGDRLMELVVLKWNLRGVCNALLDQMIHLDGVDEEEAMHLMVEEGFQEEREAAGKYRRSLLTSVQLSTYFAGYEEVVEIRNAAEAAWGEGFRIKEYHDRLLSFGSPPPRFVRALLLDEPITLS